MKKRCLIIDDNEMVVISDGIKENAKKKGLNIEFLKEFNVGSDERDDLLNENLELDEIKIFKAFSDQYRKERIDLIAIDYDLEDHGGLDGLRVIDIIRKVKPRTTIILYSADLDLILENLVDRYKKKENKGLLLMDIKTLLKKNIDKIVKRTTLETELISILDKQPLTIEDVFLKKLYELPEITFKSNFFQKADSIREIKVTPSQLIGQIESGNNVANKVMEELIERTFSYWQESIKF